MDGKRFDRLIATLHSGRSRRGTLRVLVAGALSLAAPRLASNASAQEEGVCAWLGDGCTASLPCCGRWVCLPWQYNPLVGICVRKRDLPEELRVLFRRERDTTDEETTDEETTTEDTSTA